MNSQTIELRSFCQISKCSIMEIMTRGWIRFSVLINKLLTSCDKYDIISVAFCRIANKCSRKSSYGWNKIRNIFFNRINTRTKISSHNNLLIYFDLFNYSTKYKFPSLVSLVKDSSNSTYVKPSVCVEE